MKQFQFLACSGGLRIYLQRDFLFPLPLVQANVTSYRWENAHFYLGQFQDDSYKNLTREDQRNR